MKRDPLMEKIERMRAGSKEIRESLAAKAYALDVVVDAMARATAQGFRAVRIPPPVPIDLSDTKATRQTVAELKRAGAQVDWVVRAPLDADAGERSCELVVRW